MHALSLNFRLIANFFENLMKQPAAHKNWVRIYFCQFILDTRPDFYVIAISVISQVKYKNLGYLENFLLKDLNRKIISYLGADKSTEKIDIKTFLHYQKSLKKLRSQIAKSCQKALMFLDDFRSHHSNINALYDLSNQQTGLCEKIDEIWFDLKTSCKYFSVEQALTMSLYYQLIRNNQKRSQELAKLREKLFSKFFQELTRVKKVTDKTLLDPNNIFIRISMSKNSLGTVLTSTSNLKNSYGLESKRLIGHNINMIIPKFLRNSHQTYLENHLNKGSTNRLNRNIALYGEDQAGYIVPQHVYISPQYDSSRGFSYLGVIRPLPVEEGEVIVLENGDVGGMNRELANFFGVESANITTLNFYNMCPDFRRINMMLNLHFFLQYLNIESPIWINHGTETEIEIKSSSKLPPPFNKFAEKAGNCVIPQTEDEFHTYKKISKDMLTKGFQTDFFDRLTREYQKFKVMIDVELLRDGSTIKYLHLTKIIEKKKSLVFGQLQQHEDSENLNETSIMVKSDSENVSQPDELDFAFKNNPEYFKEFGNKTANSINKTGMRSRLRTSSKFLSSKSHNMDSLSPNRKSTIKFNVKINMDVSSKECHASSRSNETDKVEEKKVSKMAKYKTAQKQKIASTLLKELKVIEKKKTQNDDGTISVHTTNKNNFDANQLETALDRNTEPWSRMVVLYFLFLCLLAQIIMAVILDIRSDINLQLVIKTLDVREYSVERKYDLIELNRRAFEIKMALLGFYPSNFPNRLEFLREGLNGLNRSNAVLHFNNINIRQSIHYFDDWIAIEYYKNKEIDVYSLYSDNERLKQNPFELINSISSAAIRLLTQDPQIMIPTDETLNFILDSSQNELLVVVDEEFAIIKEHLDQSLKVIRNILLACVIAYSSVVIAIMIIFFFQERKARRKLVLFIQALYSVSESDIDAHYENIRNYFMSFEKFEGFDENFIKKIKPKKDAHGEHSKSASRQISRNHKRLNIGIRVVIRILVLIIIMGVSVMISSILLRQFSVFTDNLYAKLGSLEILEVKNFANEYLLSSVYQYVVTKNSTTFQTLPISTKIEVEELNLRNFQQTIQDLVLSQKLDSLSTIAYDDLCKLFAQNQTLCYQHDRRSATKGFLYLSSFISLAAQTVISNFNPADPSTNSIALALQSNEFNDARIQYEQVYKKAFISMVHEINMNMNSEIEKYTSQFLKSVIGSIFVYISMGFIGYRFIYKNTLKESIERKMILRMIPMKAILKTKTLYNFLFKSTMSILDQII